MMDDINEEIVAVLPPPNNLRHIFPKTVRSGWTTAAITNEQLTNMNVIDRLPLSDAQLGVHRVSSTTTHHIRTFSDGVSRAWEAVYRKGSINPSSNVKGGFGFYVHGPQDDWTRKLAQSEEVVFSYAVRFQEGFDFVKGGKLPGIFGGEGDKAYGCSGGRRDDRCSCFDLRLMWRANGKGELYAYLPLEESNKSRLLSVPGSHENSDYGFSVGRGSFNLTPTVWTTVAERVRLNDPGQENGEIQVWIDERSVINVTGLVLRTTQQAVVKGLHFQTFFGGSTSEWASPKEQCAWFSNVSGGVIA